MWPSPPLWGKTNKKSANAKIAPKLCQYGSDNNKFNSFIFVQDQNIKVLSLKFKLNIPLPKFWQITITFENCNFLQL